MLENTEFSLKIKKINVNIAAKKFLGSIYWTLEYGN